MMAERNKPSVFVKTPVLVQDTYSVEEIAILFRVSRNSVYEWHKQEDDPLPLRRMKGKKRGLFAYGLRGGPKGKGGRRRNRTVDTWRNAIG